MSHDHDHDHDHSGGHTHDHRTTSRNRLGMTLILAATYMIAEVVGGWLTNSLALLADAGHMLSDVAALALSFFAMWIARRPASPQRTYGYYRAEILAALVNGASLGAIAILIVVEAAKRLQQPQEIAAPLMMAIAAGGLLINLACLGILHGSRDENLNLRGAWLHVLTDALGSVGALGAGAAIWLKGWLWFDPLASVLIALLVIYSGWRLLAESVAVLMEQAPRGIDVDEVRNAIRSHASVTSVHDLHVWTITSGFDALSAHVVAAADDLPAGPLLTELREMLHERFGIDHVTIQIEPSGFDDCLLAPKHRSGCDAQ